MVLSGLASHLRHEGPHLGKKGRLCQPILFEGLLIVFRHFGNEVDKIVFFVVGKIVRSASFWLGKGKLFDSGFSFEVE